MAKTFKTPKSTVPRIPDPALVDEVKEFDLGLDPDAITRSFMRHLEFTLGELPSQVDSVWEPYCSLALAVRDRLLERWRRTQDSYYRSDAKRLYYLSLEFLMGRTLVNGLINLDFLEEAKTAMSALGYEFEDLREAEWDAGLGNGGLGRLAACFLDSLATLSLPAYGYGLRYEFGMFHQRIVDGSQLEVPDGWLRYGNPWEIARPNDGFQIKFYGRVNQYVNADGRLTNDWVDTQDVAAIPYDTPIPGYRNGTVNTLRLWSARATAEFDLSFFNRGDYEGAVLSKSRSENITKVLYPNDNIFEGKELRLRQEYLFVSATLQDIIRRYKKQWRRFHAASGEPLFARFADQNAIQLNDTHPALAIPELMRLLVDIELLDWDTAWKITTGTFAYTNHTVMPEALERWPVSLLGRVLPRHLQILYEINQRFIDQARGLFHDETAIEAMSLFEEGAEKRVRMANLAIIGGHSINGVAALHTEILKAREFPDFYRLWPERFTNKTNGITPRRWLLKANPRLSGLITQAIGSDWITDLSQLTKLAPLAGDPALQSAWREAKLANKLKLKEIIKAQYERRGSAVEIDPNSLFDVHVKRIHEYKRQLLNLLHAITLYNRLKSGVGDDQIPRTVILGGKAAPGYFMAKLIIHLANAIGDRVNSDPEIGGRLRVIFLADYRVSLAEKIFPASELSEQISTAGTEASGTGNMKFALNGALTIGTWDGANIEIAQEVGPENCFLFGLKSDEVSTLQPHYNPWDYLERNPELRQAIDQIRDGFFSPQDPNLFRPIYETLLGAGRDRYLLCADFAAYAEAQREAARIYAQPEKWTRRSILNVAHMGLFSSDRTIQEYNRDIWHLTAIPATDQALTTETDLEQANPSA